MTENLIPDDYTQDVTLKDGSAVRLRPIRPDDAPRLQYGFKRLSAESIYMRFMEAWSEMTDAQARELVAVDFHNRVAFVGAIDEDGEERLVCVARYALVGAEHPGAAEAAIVVRDDYQGRGLGKLAMMQLVRYALDHGVTHLVATVHTNNRRVLEMVRKSGLTFEREMFEPGIWLISIDLTAA